jgi:hypothetical protein
VSFRTRREGRHLFMSYVHPLDAAVSKRVGNPIQAVSNNSVDALDSGRFQRLDYLVCNELAHHYPFARGQNITISVITPWAGWTVIPPISAEPKGPDISKLYIRPTCISGSCPLQRSTYHAKSVLDVPASITGHLRSVAVWLRVEMESWD